ncbi:hypothetical protein [Microtetraspora malaysiensis]
MPNDPLPAPKPPDTIRTTSQSLLSRTWEKKSFASFSVSQQMMLP